MAEIIPPQLIVTEFQIKGEADIKRFADLHAELRSKGKTTLEVDTTKAQKSVFDLGNVVTNLSDKQLANLKTKINDIPTQLKNIDPAVFNKFKKSIEGVTDEFHVLSKTVQFVKTNMDKLNLKPKEFQELTKYIAAAEYTLSKEGKTVEGVSQKHVSLRGKLAAVRNELTLLDQAGQSGSKAYVKLQVEAGKLQDQIDDNRAAVKALSSDTLKLDAGIGAIRGVVAAFTAYQGVLGFLGVENKDFEKTLLKINGAMAILQGLQEITNLLQAQSATRLVASSVATTVWTNALAIANGLLFTKTAAEVADTTAVTTNTIATIANTNAQSGLALMEANAAAAIAGETIAVEAETTALTGATAATEGATAATTGFGVAAGIAAGLIAIVVAALGVAVYYWYKVATGATAAKDAIDKLNKALIAQNKSEEEIQKIHAKGVNDRQREIDLLKSKNTGQDIIFQKEKELAEFEIANTQARIDRLNHYVGLTLEKQKALLELEDQKRELENKNQIQFNQFNKERLNKEIELNQKSIELRLEGTGIYGRDLQKRVLLAKNAYDKDLLNFEGTENEKALFASLRLQQLHREIIKLNREFDTELNKNKTTTDLRSDDLKLLDDQAQISAENIVAGFAKGLAIKTPEARKAYIDVVKKIITGSITEASIEKQINKEAIDLVKKLGTSVEQASNNRIEKTKESNATEKQLAELRISLLRNQFEKERQLNQLKHDEDIKNFIATTDNIDKQEEYIRLKDEELKRLNEGDSFLSKLLGLNKEQEDAANEAFKQSLDLLTQLADAKVANDDREIKSQEDKIARFRELAEFGTAEQLQTETDRLDKLKQAREEDAKHQKEIAAVQIATANAVTIAKGIEAIINGFATDPLTGVLNAIALAATVASTIITLNNAFGSLPAFAEGTDRIQGKGTAKSDSILARVSKDEGIYTAEQNKAMGFDTNENKVKYYLLGRQIGDNMPIMPDFKSSIPTGNFIKDDRETKELLRELISKTEMAGKNKINIVQKITNEGIVQAVETVERKRKRQER